MKRKVGRPCRDRATAVECYHGFCRGEKVPQISERHGWSNVTTRRYIRDGKKIVAKTREIRQETFGV